LKAEEKETPEALEKATNTTPAKAQSKPMALHCVVELDTNCQSSKQESDKDDSDIHSRCSPEKNKKVDNSRMQKRKKIREKAETKVFSTSEQIMV
jgi:hypothetical protein